MALCCKCSSDASPDLILVASNRRPNFERVIVKKLQAPKGSNIHYLHLPRPLVPKKAYNRSDVQRSSVRCSCTAVHNGLLSSYLPAIQNLEPHVAFAVDGLAAALLPPLVGGWVLITLISGFAEGARKWCDANPDEPLAFEAIALLPAALESPSRFAVTFLVATRVVRNLAELLYQFVDKFSPKWDSFVDVVVNWIINALGPLDQALVSLYTALAVAVTTRVLIKWKSIALEWVLKHQRVQEAKEQQQQQQQQQQDQAQGNMQQGVTTTTSSSSSSTRAVQSRPGLQVSAAGVLSLQGPGHMLSVEMRPRIAMPRFADGDEADLAVDSSSLDSTDSRDVVEESVASSMEQQGQQGGGGRKGKVRVKWFAGKSADDLERLLLPLDGILSWVLVVVAGLFTIQTLGINIQPLLAVGGAGSIIIGLATQTLLTNAVTGMSIFLSRPFVAGDSVTIQGIGNMIFSGTVEKITPLRTLLRTDEDVLVTIPNKSVSDMVIFNRSRRDARRRFKMRNQTGRQFMKFKVKQAHKELQGIEPLQDALRQVLRRPGVAQNSVELGLSKFTDAGAELLVKFLLLVAPGSPEGQRLLTDLALAVRNHGATLVSIA